MQNQKICTFVISPWHGAGNESIFTDQQPTRAAPNCDEKQDYPWTRKPVMGKYLERWSICMDSNTCFGWQSKQSHQWKIFSRQLLGWHWSKPFSALTSKAAPHPCTRGQSVGAARVPFLHCRTLLHLEWAVDVQITCLRHSTASWRHGGHFRRNRSFCQQMSHRHK